MTPENKAMFKSLFSVYCRDEINKGHCRGEDECAMCIINDTYEIIFNEIEAEDD
jgi:hypothetical protein